MGRPRGGQSRVRVYKDGPCSFSSHLSLLPPSFFFLPFFCVLFFFFFFLASVLLLPSSLILPNPSHAIPSHFIQSHPIPSYHTLSHSIPSHPTPFPPPLRDPVPKNNQFFRRFFGPACVRIPYVILLRRGLLCNVENVCAKDPIGYMACGPLEGPACVRIPYRIHAKTFQNFLKCLSFCKDTI